MEIQDYPIQLPFVLSYLSKLNYGPLLFERFNLKISNQENISTGVHSFKCLLCANFFIYAQTLCRNGRASK
jgi:hypothetical protein